MIFFDVQIFLALIDHDSIRLLVKQYKLQVIAIRLTKSNAFDAKTI